MSVFILLYNLKMNGLAMFENLQKIIFKICGQRLMIDCDLAELYDEETKKIKQATTCNIEPFLSDFMFQLTNDEQNKVMTFCNHLGKLKYSLKNAYVLTEYGVTRLSSILRSKKAIEINIQIVRAFVALRQFAKESKDLSEILSEVKKYFIQNFEENRVDIFGIRKILLLLMDRMIPLKVDYRAGK